MLEKKNARSIELFPNDFLEIHQGLPRFAIRLHFGLRSQKGPDDRNGCSV